MIQFGLWIFGESTTEVMLCPQCVLLEGIWCRFIPFLEGGSFFNDSIPFFPLGTPMQPQQKHTVLQLAIANNSKLPLAFLKEFAQSITSLKSYWFFFFF